MFAFLCPIRHPLSSENYDQVIKLLSLTIESICNQKTDRPFMFLVVCNEIPDLPVIPDNVKFLSVDLLPPDKNKGTKVAYDAITSDKGLKVATGLIELKKYSPEFVYIMDGDDWFNTSIVDTAYRMDADLCFANEGYTVNMKSKTFIKKYGVCRYCGSTFIYRYNKLMTATGLASSKIEEPSIHTVTELVNDHTLRYILGNHRHQLSYFKKMDWRISELPIDAVAWLCNTGENWSTPQTNEDGPSLNKKFLSRFGILTFNPPSTKSSIKKQILGLKTTAISWLGWKFADKSADKV